MTTPTHSHKSWTDNGGHVICTSPKTCRHSSSQPHKVTSVATATSQQLPALPQSFFARPAEVVAPELSGSLLVKPIPHTTKGQEGVLWPLLQLRALLQVGSDGVREWHPSFLQLAPSLRRCSKRFERFSQKYRYHIKVAPKCHWGSRMLKRLVEKGRISSRSKQFLPGQQQLPFAFDFRLNQIPQDWQHIAVRIRRANGICAGDRERSIW
jgi:hypothetical protein